MFNQKTWREQEITENFPRCYYGWDEPSERPSTFNFAPGWMQAPPHRAGVYTARLYWRNGWTGLIFSSTAVFFVDEILTFDAMIDLINARFPRYLETDTAIVRDYD
jgi:hypothetical protein